MTLELFVILIHTLQILPHTSDFFSCIADAFHPGGRKSVHYSSNAVPMYEGFKSGIKYVEYDKRFKLSIKFDTECN